MIDIISDNELVIRKGGSSEVEFAAQGALPQERTTTVQAALH